VCCDPIPRCAAPLLRDPATFAISRRAEFVLNDDALSVLAEGVATCRYVDGEPPN